MSFQEKRYEDWDIKDHKDFVEYLRSSLIRQTGFLVQEGIPRRINDLIDRNKEANAIIREMDVKNDGIVYHELISKWEYKTPKGRKVRFEPVTRDIGCYREILIVNEEYYCGLVVIFKGYRGKSAGKYRGMGIVEPLSDHPMCRDSDVTDDFNKCLEQTRQNFIEVADSEYEHQHNSRGSDTWDINIRLDERRRSNIFLPMYEWNTYVAKRALVDAMLGDDYSCHFGLLDKDAFQFLRDKLQYQNTWEKDLKKRFESVTNWHPDFYFTDNDEMLYACMCYFASFGQTGKYLLSGAKKPKIKKINLKKFKKSWEFAEKECREGLEMSKITIKHPVFNHYYKFNDDGELVPFEYEVDPVSDQE